MQILSLDQMRRAQIVDCALNCGRLMKLPFQRTPLVGALEGWPSKKLWFGHLRRRWWIYFLGMISVVGTNLEVMIPKVTQWIIDLVGQNLKAAQWMTVPRLVFMLTGIMVLQYFARVGWRVTLGQETHRIAGTMKSDLWNRIRFFPRSRLDSDLSTGELMNVATGDVGSARMIFGFTIVGTVDFIFLSTFTIIAMFTINMSLTLWTLLITPALPYFLDRLARKESAQHKAAQASLTDLTDMVSQAASTMRLQRLSGTTNFWQQQLVRRASEYRVKRFEVVKTELAFIPVTGTTPLISLVVLLVMGIQKVLHGEMTVGALVAMQSYVFMIQGPLFELGVIVSEWQRCCASLDRYTHVMRQPEVVQLREGGIKPVAQSIVYQVQDLRFSYGEKSVELFHDLSFDLKQGERLGIIGPVGAGKSTLISILAGLERDFQGSVKLFEQNILDYSHEAMREKIGFVPQKSFLFANTIGSNIAVHRKLNDDEIWHYLELADVADDVRKFPKGLQTKLGEWGVNLSGGQKQRLTLARALAARPEILLMDDCLSAVDTVTEDKILKSLDEHLAKVTLIWVAHRASTLRSCNRVLELGQVHAMKTQNPTHEVHS